MKTLSWLATGIAFSGFLVGVAHAAPPAPQARWTIMVYMSGDNNLEDFIVKDIGRNSALPVPTQIYRSSHWPIAGPAMTRVAAIGRRPSSTM